MVEDGGKNRKLIKNILDAEARDKVESRDTAFSRGLVHLYIYIESVGRVKKFRLFCNLYTG